MTQNELLYLGYRYICTIEEKSVEIWAKCVDETVGNRVFQYYYFSPKTGETICSLNVFSEREIEIIKTIINSFN